MEFNIALLRGDGIGPEIVDSAVLILKKPLKNSNINLILRLILSAARLLTQQEIRFPRKP